MIENTKKCPYCAEEIKLEAIKCKHCGEILEIKSNSEEKVANQNFNKKNKLNSIFIVIALILIILLIYIGKSNSDENISEIRTYSKNWRLPENGYEFREIGKTIVKNSIKVCGEYYVKEVISNEYIIACTPDGINWNYFVINLDKGEITPANNQIIRKITPPR